MTSFELQTRDGIGGEETLEVEQMDNQMDSRMDNRVDSPMDNQMDNRKKKSSSIQDEVSHNKDVVFAESSKVASFIISICINLQRHPAWKYQNKRYFRNA